MKGMQQRSSSVVAGVFPGLAACGWEWATAAKMFCQLWLAHSASFGSMLLFSSIKEERWLTSVWPHSPEPRTTPGSWGCLLIPIWHCASFRKPQTAPPFTIPSSSVEKNDTRKTFSWLKVSTQRLNLYPNVFVISSFSSSIHHHGRASASG